MPESLRRSLADPFSLGDDLPTWHPPALGSFKPDTVRAGIRELERALQPGSPGHIAWCVGKMSHAMASRKGDATTWAMRMEGWLDACGHFPDDLWNAGTIELLQTKTYFPSPSEMVALIGPKYLERKRMLDRAKSMLTGPAGAPEKPAEKPLESRLERLQHTRSIYVRMKRIVDVERIDREIAKETGQAPASTVREVRTVEPTERPPFTPEASPTAKRCADLAAARRAGKPAPERRDVPETEQGAAA